MKHRLLRVVRRLFQYQVLLTGGPSGGQVQGPGGERGGEAPAERRGRPGQVCMTATSPPTVAGRGGEGRLVLLSTPVKVPGTEPTPFLPLSSRPPLHVDSCLSVRLLHLAAASPSQTHSNSHLPLICISSLASVGLVSLNLFLSPEPS